MIIMIHVNISYVQEDENQEQNFLIFYYYRKLIKCEYPEL